MSNISHVALKAEDSDALDWTIRVGLAAYGLIHVLVGWLALQVAFGEKSKQASSSGALEYLARQPLGGFLIWVVAIGLLALVVWRLLEIWQAVRREDGADMAKSVASQALKAVLYAILAWSALQVATGSSKGGGGGTEGLTAQVLKMTGGQLIVGAAGLAVIGYGGYYVYQGWSDSFLKKLDGGPRNAEVSKAYRLVGKAGHFGKGIAVAVIGALLLYAAVTHNPNKSAGLDQALQEVAQAPFGQVLLTLVALGIVCFGAFCFARARHFDR